MPRQIVVLEFNSAHAFGNPTERVIKIGSPIGDRAPTLRPAKLSGLFRTMLEGSDFSKSERISTAGVATLIFPLKPRPLATYSASP
jgi:hypothetical protein